jgi:hypothetical protein
VGVPESIPGRTLTMLRFIVGGGTWLAPRTAGRIFGLDVDANPQASYVGRLFGVRDAILGVGLAATSGDARRLWWRVGVACDLADVVAGVLGRRSGDLPARSAAMLTGTAIAAASLGAAALAADDA